MKGKGKFVPFIIISIFFFSLAHGYFSKFQLLFHSRNGYIEDYDKIQLRSAGDWILSPLIIDDNGGSDYTWEEAKSENWCNGSGTWGDPYVIENVSIDGSGTGYCLYIRDSVKYFEIRNCTFSNSEDDTFDAGLKLEDVNNGLVENNSFLNNGRYGILLMRSRNNSVLENKANSNDHTGIRLIQGHNNTILRNIACNNDNNGIFLYSVCHNNTISENIINFTEVPSSLTAGIHLREGCHYNEISNNSVNGDIQKGIYLLEHCNSNIISDNSITGTGNFGIRLKNVCEYNSIIGNWIFYSDNYGIYLWNSDNNILYLNRLRNPGALNALDEGENNCWDNGSIGNWWHDYAGIDNNDDGIGDTPYEINPSPLIQDQFPIWDDGDDDAPPNITVLLPGDYQTFGHDAPEYEVKIDGLYTNSTWYSLNETSNYTINKLTGQVNQTIWDKFGNGTLTLSFFVNDSKGNIDFDEIEIYKETHTSSINIPIVKINSPQNYTYWNSTPTINSCVYTPHPNYTWYSIGNDCIFIDNNTNYLLNNSIWEKITDGEFVVNFYANNSEGDINDSCYVKLYKDTTRPNTSMFFVPHEGEKLVNKSTLFNLTAIDENGSGISDTWYNINDSSWIEYVEEFDLSQENYGNYTISYYSRDVAGNIEDIKNVSISLVKTKSSAPRSNYPNFDPDENPDDIDPPKDNTSDDNLLINVIEIIILIILYSSISCIPVTFLMIYRKRLFQ